ncbi:AER129Cp [Eremothecium gossypii ATCC 10895]|uniref:AER129Cp n=1 Tax=Eremothecium gossypii (strain ATCC 10895 / CBS 109.51 / FGSC 9923 / NRRL Y-1056) TaxID=284811 RepID=Q756Y5_EREGS|nr:AER129Cp [Eremothecium gossypii ATCC 10895]AAS52812.1 AER129Cp [Eremothecium gossypii ATCC 10895]AEY97118.1 FAER129Cp [Eremothecium gossypii FDAG1]
MKQDTVMLKDRLYILLSVLATRGDVERVEKCVVYDSELSVQEVLEVICVFWPEVDDPERLWFVYEGIERERQSTGELEFELINSEAELQALVDADADVVRGRAEMLRSHVRSRLEAHSVAVDVADCAGTFARARTVLVNEVEPDVLFHSGIIRRLRRGGRCAAVTAWERGILRPLAHANCSISRPLLVSAFEQLTPAEALELFVEPRSDEPAVHRAVLLHEVVPYVTFKQAYQEFLDVFLTPEQFPLTTLENFEFLKYMTKTVRPLFAEQPGKKKVFDRKLLQLLYDRGESLAEIPLPDLPRELYGLLLLIDETVTLSDGVSVKDLIEYTKYMDAANNYSLKSMRSLANADELAQLASFNSISHYLLAESPSVQTLQFLLSSSKLYPKLTKENQESAIIETLLSLSEFTLLHDFSLQAGFQVEKSVILKYFWRFFNSAPNGSRDRPEMTKARNNLRLLPKKDYYYLETLLDVADALAKYSLSYSRGQPFRPSHILDLKDDPFRIISKLLETNPSLYRDVETTFEILKQLYEGLQLQPHDPKYTSEYTRLLVCHIDCALANMEFKFAYDKVIELLENHDGLGEHWSTIFQVGKYIDPTWPDNEVPTEIIYLQMEVLSRLLHICPVEDVEAVVSTWSGLELELSTRTDVRDVYSLSNNSTNPKHLRKEIVQQVSSSVSNFLSDGIKWAIGEGK